MRAKSISVFLLCLLFSSGVAAASAEFNSIAKQGASVGEAGLSEMNAKQELGVEATGSLRNGGQGVGAEFSQTFSGALQCPEDPSQTGKYANVLQFVSACNSISGSQKSVFICVPNDSTDTADNDCNNGSWYVQTLSATSNAWKDYVSGLKGRLTDCDGEDCTLELEKSGSFEGGEEDADAQGNAAINNAQGSTQVVRDQGAYLPNGTVLQSGRNENSGEYLSELTAADSVAACADDVKTSLDNGTPVFTCDGSGDVGALSEDGNICEDVETCDEWSTSTREFEKTCESSVPYGESTCDVEYEQQTCQLSNAKTTETCTVTQGAQLKAALPLNDSCTTGSVGDSTLGDGARTKVISVPEEFLGKEVFVGIAINDGTPTCDYCGGITNDFSGDVKSFSTVLTSRSVTLSADQTGSGGFFNATQYSSYKVGVNGGWSWTGNGAASGTTVWVSVCVKPENPDISFQSAHDDGGRGMFQFNRTDAAYTGIRPYGSIIPSNPYVGYDSPDYVLKSPYDAQGWKVHRSYAGWFSSDPDEILVYTTDSQKVCEQNL